MRDSVQKFLMSTKGTLSPLQAIDLTSYESDSDEANRLLQRLIAEAEKEDAYALTLCASCYRSGWGTKIDGERAFYWAKKAAQTGFPPGVAELGFCYEEGIGTEISIGMALEKLRCAAEGGYSMAGLHLAIQYASGAPYGSSVYEAVRYAEMAFKSGEPYAAHLVGTWYEEGTFLQKDWIAAGSWYKKAAGQGSQLACIRLAMAYKNGELGLERNSTHYAEFLDMAASNVEF
jgi:uncharacterized protein